MALQDADAGWRADAAANRQRSLPEVNATIAVPLGGHWCAPAAGVSRARLSGLGRLHGSRQLGDRSRRRIEVRLHAAVGHPAVEPDGDPAAGARRAARHRHRPRSRAGLPRQLFAAGQFHAVAGLRGRDHRLRSGGSDRHRDCAETAVRHSPDRRRADHRARRLPAAAADEQGLPLPRSLRHLAADRHRGLLCDPDLRRRAAGCRDAARLPAVDRDRHQSGDALHRHRHHRRHRDAA